MNDRRTQATCTQLAFQTGLRGRPFAHAHSHNINLDYRSCSCDCFTANEGNSRTLFQVKARRAPQSLDIGIKRSNEHPDNRTQNAHTATSEHHIRPFPTRYPLKHHTVCSIRQQRIGVFHFHPCLTKSNTTYPSKNEMSVRRRTPTQPAFRLLTLPAASPFNPIFDRSDIRN